MGGEEIWWSSLKHKRAQVSGLPDLAFPTRPSFGYEGGSQELRRAGYVLWLKIGRGRDGQGLGFDFILFLSK